ncbi:MAG TPA: hypothetical protein VM346_07500 [Sphingomicrobium sp.]|nr:hypothetical protein [Sphingomicrobium sp.]
MIAIASTLVFGAGLWLAATTLVTSLGDNRTRIVRALGGIG